MFVHSSRTNDKQALCCNAFNASFGEHFEMHDNGIFLAHLCKVDLPHRIVWRFNPLTTVAPRAMDKHLRNQHPEPGKCLMANRQRSQNKKNKHTAWQWARNPSTHAIPMLRDKILICKILRYQLRASESICYARYTERYAERKAERYAAHTVSAILILVDSRSSQKTTCHQRSNWKIIWWLKLPCAKT